MSCVPSLLRPVAGGLWFAKRSPVPGLLGACHLQLETSSVTGLTPMRQSSLASSTSDKFYLPTYT